MGGEAESITQSLTSSRKIADVNYISSQVNRKYLLNGVMTSDPSQVRVQVITTDAKAQQVVDAIVTPLTGASSEYIASVIKSTTFSVTTYQTTTREIPREMRTMMVAHLASNQGQNLAP